jgi:hypothetical protein
MAHFAKLDDNNVVLEVHVVNNAVLDPANEEASGIAFLTEWSNGYSNWKQASYNRNFRKHYPGMGWVYDSELDAFYEPNAPFPGWTFNRSTCTWEAPVPAPTPTGTEIYTWDEVTSSWKEVTPPPASMPK